MNHHQWLSKQAGLSLERLRPRLEPVVNVAGDPAAFFERLDEQFPRLFRLLYDLYGSHYDFFYHLEQILLHAAQMYVQRAPELKRLDAEREENPQWFQSHKMIGAVAYVDLFAGDLAGLHQKIPYLKELGVTYLHLMPLFKSPERNSDGGYAVSDYRSVRDDLGTMQQLAGIAAELRNEGISLVLDMVFNHTSDEHTWAKRALAGDETYMDYYYMFPDRELPDQYEQTLREIFPEQAPGSFTYRPEVDRWVWTTFYQFQWDLNYKNPQVFNAMLGEMLFLANQGVEVLRLDAVAFIWKEMGTPCESLPQAHMIIQALNALTRIVCPALLFKSEAIVHPDEVMSYVGWEESPISYNPLMMALLWESLATRKAELLQLSMSKRYTLKPYCAWVNYVRVHDDIGWTFADEDAAELWINGYDHRQFLNRFYIGDFPGSFARGVPFGYNPESGDMRISGTAASLAGVEDAAVQEDDHALEMAVRRILLLYSVALSAGGIPLIYLGDEIGMLNDYSYREHPDKREDSRWVHRPAFDWDRAAQRTDKQTIPGRIFNELKKLIQTRKTTPVFEGCNTTFFSPQNEHVLAYLHNRRLLVLANFSEDQQQIRREVINAYAVIDEHSVDLLTGERFSGEGDITLGGLTFRWLLIED